LIVRAANSRDQFGTGNKFIAPTIANGKVYVGTTTGVGVFGLLHSASLAPTALSTGSVGGGLQPCEINGDGTVNIQDVQVAVRYGSWFVNLHGECRWAWSLQCRGGSKDHQRRLG
jgi:hypothetical protein